MFSEQNRPSSFSLVLTTSIVSSEKQNILVYATCEHRGNDLYVASLRSKENGSCFGTVDFTVAAERDKQYFGDLLYNNKIRSKVLSHVEINYIKNSSTAHKHVGNALFECVFRVSILLGCEGRIKLNAVRNTHYFHYQNGFRSNLDIDFYYKLASALLNAKNKKIEHDLGSANLYLTRTTILENLKRFGINHNLADFSTEIGFETNLIRKGEAILNEGEGWAFKVIQALKQRYSALKPPISPANFSLTFFTPDDATRDSEDSTGFSQLNDTNITRFFEKGVDLIAGLLPIDTPEKEENLVVLLTGVLILAMSSHDKSNDNQVLYPYGTFDQFNVGKRAIQTIGAQAIIDKKLPFNFQMSEDFLPALIAIPELKELFERYTPLNLKI